MIDEKKLKDDIWKYALTCKNTSFEFARRMIDIEKIIDEQPKLPFENKTSDKWIPCSERLPEEGDDIIGTYDNGDGHVLVGQSVYFPQLLDKPYPLTAWRPLPPTYKGE